MSLKKLAVIGFAIAGLSLGQQALAQDELTCADIEWSSVVTDQYPNIANACDAVMEKNGRMYARVEVQVQRVRGNTITFKVLNNDGSSGGSYTQNVGMSWRAKIGGQSYRASELMRGQKLNVYMPHDRWAVIHVDADGPDIADAVPLVSAPMLPKTASQLPLIGMLGACLLVLGAGLGVIRRRVAA
ncbi:MAG: LPXTG cell wall anchor domain-containing protein [Halieaceae bacterium]